MISLSFQCMLCFFYKGQPTKIRIQTEIHIEDVDKEVVLYMFSIQELVDIIDEEMLKVEDEREF